MHTIQHLLHIQATPDQVFEALSSLEGLRSWWTQNTQGDPQQGGVIQFRFGPWGMDMQVTELVPGQKVAWKCVSEGHDWLNHNITFALDQNDGKTRLRFSHADWQQLGDAYGSCSFGWGRYLESLRQYLQTGKGNPF